MGTSDESSSGPDVIKPNPRRRVKVRTLIVLIACSGMLLWAGRTLWERHDPVAAEARAIQNRAIDALKSTKAAERVTAIRELERLGFGDSAIAIRPLNAALVDEDSEVRVAAAEALGKLVSSAIRAGSGARDVRAATTALIASLKDPLPEVRIAAASTLGTIASTLPAAGAGRTSRDRKKTLSAVRPVPPVDPKTVFDSLVEAIGDRDAKVRGAVLGAMAAVDSGAPVDPPKVLSAGLEDESPENRRTAIVALTRFRRGLDPWISTLVRIAEHDDDRSLRATCANALNGIKPPAVTSDAVPALVTGLGNSDAQVRIQVALLLGRLGPDAGAAVPSLLRVLTEPVDPQLARSQSGVMMHDDDPANAAALALGRIAPRSKAAREVIVALTEVARCGHRIRRGDAAFALGDFGPAAAEAVPVLINMIKDTTPPARNVHNEALAARALGQIAPETPSADQAVAALVCVLESDTKAPRAEAIEALQQFGQKAAVAIPKIRSQLDERDHLVRRAAASALPVL